VNVPWEDRSRERTKTMRRGREYEGQENKRQREERERERERENVLRAASRNASSIGSEEEGGGRGRLFVRDFIIRATGFGNECAIIGETVVKASQRGEGTRGAVGLASVASTNRTIASSPFSICLIKALFGFIDKETRIARLWRQSSKMQSSRGVSSLSQPLDQVRAEAKVITDVIPVGELHSRRRVSRSLTTTTTTTTTTMNVDVRRGSAASRLVSGARLYVNRLMERRFGYNWISLVRYCKYWQPGKLPTQ